MTLLAIRLTFPVAAKQHDFSNSLPHSLKTSSGLFRIEHQLKVCDLIAQRKAALLQTPQRQLVHRGLSASKVNEAVKIGVFHAQLNQSAMGQMKVFLHGGNLDETRGLRHTVLQGAALQRTSKLEIGIIVFP